MIVPFIIGAVVLGRAFNIFDMNTSTFDIFDPKDIESNLKVMPNEISQSKYKVIEKSFDAIDFLNLDPGFALKVRQRSYRLPLPYSAVSSSFNSLNVLKILFYVSYKKETHTFPPTVKQLANWKDRSQEDVGTHYILGIQYGREMLMSFTIKASKTEYMPEIRKVVATFIGSDGAIDSSLPGKLDQMNSALKDKAFTSFHFEASGVSANPFNLQDGIKVALQFQDEIQKSKGDKGFPLRLYLEDLHSLYTGFKPYQRNLALQPVLRKAFDKYDDVSIAKEAYQQFEDEHSYMIWTPQQEDMLDDFYGKVMKVKNAIVKAIVKLDFTGSEHQFDEAFKVYGDGEYKYQIELQELIQAILKHENK